MVKRVSLSETKTVLAVAKLPMGFKRKKILCGSPEAESVLVREHWQFETNGNACPNILQCIESNLVMES